MAKVKQCAGVARLAIAPHDAPVAEFGLDSTTKDGLYRICKVCDAHYQKAWRDAKKMGVTWTRKAATKADPTTAAEAKVATDETQRMPDQHADADTTPENTSPTVTQAQEPASSAPANDSVDDWADGISPAEAKRIARNARRREARAAKRAGAAV